jgi:hypothetical protein
MNAKALTIPEFNFLEKKYIASRIECVFHIVLFSLYLIEGNRPLWATVIPIVLIAVFVFQFIFQKNAVNGIFGGIIILIGLYFSLAVWSEFSEFEVVNDTALQLLLVGWLGRFLIIAFGVIMVWRFILEF